MSGLGLKHNTLTQRVAVAVAGRQYPATQNGQCRARFISIQCYTVYSCVVKKCTMNPNRNKSESEDVAYRSKHCLQAHPNLPSSCHPRVWATCAIAIGTLRAGNVAPGPADNRVFVLFVIFVGFQDFGGRRSTWASC